MTLDWYDLQNLAGQILPLIVPAAGAAYTWYATMKAAARKEIADLTALVATLTRRLDSTDLKLLAAGHTADALTATAEELDGHDRRISRVEQTLEHLPSTNDMHDLQLVIVRLEGTVGRLEEKVTGIGHTVGNLDSYMRSEKGTA